MAFDVVFSPWYSSRMVAAPRMARKRRTKPKARPSRPRHLSRGAKCLAKYLSEHGLSLRAFGEILGISRGQVGMYTSGRSKPSLDLAVKIEQVTKGAVPCDAWVDGWTVPVPAIRP